MHLISKRVLKNAALSAVLAACAVTGFAQVSPNEIADPQLRSAEQTYLPKLLSINRSVGTVKFPFLFSLNRYVGMGAKAQAGSDQRGLEFVNFHGRLVLKTTGNYDAAYNASLLSPNQRAARTMDDVIEPILQLMAPQFSADDKFDAFGFEIGYHVRTKTSGLDYEGRENLVVVMDKADAFQYLTTESDPGRQQVLSRTDIFINGKPIGVLRNAPEPFSLETADKAVLNRQPALPDIIGEEDVRKLQTRYQSQLDLFAADGAKRFHFVDYAPPGLTVFRSQIYLQMTLRNTGKFDDQNGSIYKRAARSFDLFLAPQLKATLEAMPHIAAVAGAGFTVLSQVDSSDQPSSEALEFFFPLAALERFAKSEITNQDLINQGAVLVNGVRISLDLQRVE